MEGDLVYDYNPLRVFRLNNPNQGNYYQFTSGPLKSLSSLSDGDYLLSNTGKYNSIKVKNNKFYIDGEEVSVEYIKENYLNNGNYFYTYKKPNNNEQSNVQANQIIELDTNLLNFSITRPLLIDAQEAYDGSVNLIINDGVTFPKLINSRFTSIGNNKYKIIDRSGDNDTNIYNQSSFNTDISLQKITNGIVDIQFNGVHGNGNLPVGNYVFYFKLSDDDNNTTDFIGESSIVTCHKGNLEDPFSIEGGVEDQNSYKQVHFTLNNIDASYNKVIVYYSRQTSTITGVSQTKYKKILQKYDIFNNRAVIHISGFEDTVDSTSQEINAQYQIIGSAKAQAIQQNMLFLGNLKSPEINYKALKNLALHFYPVVERKSVGHVDQDYRLSLGNDGEYKGEYYNTDNIYHYTGYWNDEIYRFGIVFILNDNTLTPVFNIRGRDEITTNDKLFKPIKLLSNNSQDQDQENYEVFNKLNSNTSIEEILEDIYEVPFDIENNIIEDDAYWKSSGDSSIISENTKGVFKINCSESQLTKKDSYALGINIRVDNKNVVEILKRYTKGFFLVRQKRLATTLCQAITVGYDKISHLPLLPVQEGYMTESFLNEDRILDHTFQNRIITSQNGVKGLAAISPEYEVRQNFFNTLFTSTNYTAKLSNDQYQDKYLQHTGSHYYPINEFKKVDNNQLGEVYIQAVPDSTPAIRNKNYLYSSQAGEEATAYRFSSVFKKSKAEKNTSITRGNWGPYLGFELSRRGFSDNLQRIDIKIPNYSISKLSEYFLQRYQDQTPYYAIMPRLSWFDYNINKGYTAFRGDCYICNFTHRMNRNFQDPSFPINDDILDEETWKEHYKRKTAGKTSTDQEHNITFTIKNDGSVTANPDEDIDIAEREKINRGDVNAVKMGHWVTLKVMSTHNLSMRSIDESIVTELATNHKGRTFYPLYPMSSEGTNKIPDSYIMNEGYGKTTSEKHNFIKSDTPFEKSIFTTRIAYSDINPTTSISNNFRVFRQGHYRDYSNQYGELVKLVPFGSNLVCIMEHGIGIVSVNEKAVAAQSQTGVAYITSVNVLPEKMTILSDMFGSQWPESVILTPTAIYGVDTVAKKIWKCNGESVQVISDFAVQKFLNDNISLKEQETSPIVGIRNVKTHYNAFKKDVMFTFYDDLNTIEDKVWNLCYNEENPGKFVTFYSWIPSYSANIDNIYFSFDRQASKDLACLFDYNSNIILGNGKDNDHIIDEYGNLTKSLQYTNSEYYQMEIDHKYRSSQIYELYTSSGNVAEIDYNYTNQQAYILRIVKTPADIERIPIKIQKYIKDENGRFILGSTDSATVVTCTQEYRDKLQNYFWKHGQAGLMNLDIPIKVTNWYGQQHPFEFEFVVNDDAQVHKIFDNLMIVSSKAQPESIHYEVVGETYNFAKDKENMYYRQEATKHFYQYNGYNLSYDYDYMKLNPKHRFDKYYRYYDKSTIFPLRVSRKDDLNTIYDTYQRMTSDYFDYQSLSGSEIVWDKLLNDFKIITHSKIYPIDGYEEVPISQYSYTQLVNKTGVLVRSELINGERHFYKLVPYGRRLGNAEYKEDRWLIQIPSINYSEYNEPEWKNEIPPLNIYYQKLPEEETQYTLLYKSQQRLVSFPDSKLFKNKDGKILYKYNDLEEQLINSSKDWGNIKQTRIRDKYIKIKVRYSGKDLAVIQAILTSYTQSFA